MRLRNANTPDKGTQIMYIFCICIYMHAHTHIQIHTRIMARAHRSCIYLYMYIYARTYTYTYTYKDNVRCPFFYNCWIWLMIANKTSQVHNTFCVCHLWGEAIDQKVSPHSYGSMTLNSSIFRSFSIRLTASSSRSLTLWMWWPISVRKTRCVVCWGVSWNYKWPPQRQVCIIPNISGNDMRLRPHLITGVNFNPSMDK